MCSIGTNKNTPGFYFCLYFTGSEISLQSTSPQKNKQLVSQLGEKKEKKKQKRKKRFCQKLFRRFWEIVGVLVTVRASRWTPDEYMALKAYSRLSLFQIIFYKSNQPSTAYCSAVLLAARTLWRLVLLLLLTYNATKRNLARILLLCYKETQKNISTWVTAVPWKSRIFIVCL